MAGACSSDDESVLMGPLEEGEFIVEKILGKSTIKGKPHYLVKWKEFPEYESSWEPVENLNCDKLLAKFEAELAKKEGRAPRAVLVKNEGRASRASSAKNEGRTLREVSAKNEGIPRAASTKNEDRIPPAVSTRNEGRITRAVSAKNEGRTPSSLPAPSASFTADVSGDDANTNVDNVLTREIVQQVESVLTCLPRNKTPVSMCSVEYLQASETLSYLIVWKNGASLPLVDEWILADVFKAKYPEIVIAYYESLMSFSDDERDEMDVMQRRYKAIADAEERQKKASVKIENISHDHQMHRVLGLDSDTDVDDIEENTKVPLLDSDTSSSDDVTSSEDDTFRPININSLNH